MCLKAMREKKGLPQRKPAHELGISQNYVPAIEAGSRKAGAA
jgi:cytoskeletal protein RodZ